MLYVLYYRNVRAARGGAPFVACLHLSLLSSGRVSSLAPISDSSPSGRRVCLSPASGRDKPPLRCSMRRHVAQALCPPPKRGRTESAACSRRFRLGARVLGSSLTPASTP